MDDTPLRKLHMTDECHAHLSGKVNKQNFDTGGLRIQAMKL